jgi:hypothetical protein
MDRLPRQASVDEAELLLKYCDFNLVISDFQMPVRYGGLVIQLLHKEIKSFSLVFSRHRQVFQQAC